jgi:plasmid stabilization system protein ParE
MESNRIDFEIIWTRTAYNSFDLNIEFIKRKWGDTIIERFIFEADKTIEKLKINPSLYSRSITYPKYHRAIIHKNVSLFYRHSSNKVYILLFWENRQDPKFLKELLSKI